MAKSKRLSPLAYLALVGFGAWWYMRRRKPSSMTPVQAQRAALTQTGTTYILDPSAT